MICAHVQVGDELDGVVLQAPLIVVGNEARPPFYMYVAGLILSYVLPELAIAGGNSGLYP